MENSNPEPQPSENQQSNENKPTILEQIKFMYKFNDNDVRKVIKEYVNICDFTLPDSNYLGPRILENGELKLVFAKDKKVDLEEKFIINGEEFPFAPFARRSVSFADNIKPGNTYYETTMGLSQIIRSRSNFEYKIINYFKETLGKNKDTDENGKVKDKDLRTIQEGDEFLTPEILESLKNYVKKLRYIGMDQVMSMTEFEEQIIDNNLYYNKDTKKLEKKSEPAPAGGKRKTRRVKKSKKTNKSKKSKKSKKTKKNTKKR